MEAISEIYFATADTGLLYALDAQSGAKLFSFETKHNGCNFSQHGRELAKHSIRNPQWPFRGLLITLVMP